MFLCVYGSKFFPKKLLKKITHFVNTVTRFVNIDTKAINYHHKKVVLYICTPCEPYLTLVVPRDLPIVKQCLNCPDKILRILSCVQHTGQGGDMSRGESHLSVIS